MVRVTNPDPPHRAAMNENASSASDQGTIDRRRAARFEQHIALSLWYRYRGRLNRILAESLDVSATGLRFVCGLHFEDETLFVSTPESEARKEFAEVRIMRRRRLSDGRWESGARLQSLL